jgi:hypothetical protein
VSFFRAGSGSFNYRPARGGGWGGGGGGSSVWRCLSFALLNLASVSEVWELLLAVHCWRSPAAGYVVLHDAECGMRGSGSHRICTAGILATG